LLSAAGFIIGVFSGAGGGFETEADVVVFCHIDTAQWARDDIFSVIAENGIEYNHAAPATVKTIDLTARHGKGDDGRPSAMMPQSARLPPGLTLRQVLCTQLHKDLHVYTILTSCIAPGPVLLFCNSVKGAKRVSETLIALMGEGRIKLLVGDMAQVSS
jgi:hypothetical protein